MKNKHHKKESTIKLKDEVGEKIHRPKSKPKKDKVKYRHMNHWLEEVDDFDLPKYEEE